jgi:hypothetical protein
MITGINHNATHDAVLKWVCAPLLEAQLRLPPNSGDKVPPTDARMKADRGICLQTATLTKVNENATTSAVKAIQTKGGPAVRSQP